MQIVIPANIRFSIYKSVEDVKIENKFAGLPIKIPLLHEMAEAKIIQKITNKIKNSVGLIYASYALTFYTTLLGPRFLPRLFLHDTSMKMTTAFSNVPGPLKPFEFI
jgi:hypothetical protein